MKVKYNNKKKAIQNIINTTELTSENLFGVPNFAPDRYPGMDEVSIDFFINTMKGQAELCV